MFVGLLPVERLMEASLFVGSNRVFTREVLIWFIFRASLLCVVNMVGC